MQTVISWIILGWSLGFIAIWASLLFRTWRRNRKKRQAWQSYCRKLGL